MLWAGEGRHCCSGCQHSTQSCSVGALRSREEGRARVLTSQSRKRSARVVLSFTLIINECVNVSKGFLSCANLQRM